MNRFNVVKLADDLFVECIDDDELYLFNDGKVYNWTDMIEQIGAEETVARARFSSLEEITIAIIKNENSGRRKYSYDFPMAGMAADCIILHKFGEDWKILLIKRGGEPYKSMLALPGGFVNVQTELIKDACIREILEEVSVELRECDVNFFKVADKVDRDPRGRTITFVYSTVLSEEQVQQVKAGDDAESYEWYLFNDSLLQCMKFAFDHKDILNDFLNSQLR